MQIPLYKKENVPSHTDNSNFTITYEIQCEKHILTTFVIPDVLLFLSFVYGLYIFRWVQTEQLSTLTETVSHLKALVLKYCIDIVV